MGRRKGVFFLYKACVIIKFMHQALKNDLNKGGNKKKEKKAVPPTLHDRASGGRIINSCIP